MKISRLVTLFIFLMTAAQLLAGDPSQAQTNADHWQLWTLIPPLVAILLAFITKNVITSLFLGVFSGTYILSLNQHGFISSLLYGFIRFTLEAQAAISDPWNAGIILQTLTIGGLIALVSKMGGAKAIAEALAKKARSARSAQIYTWLLGIFIFFDDYANALTVGPIMRPVTDKLRISREKLAFIIDATAAPIAGIALISTWVGYEIGLIRDGFSIVGKDVNAYGVFVSTIPFRFYNIFILTFIVGTAWFIREFGPMYKAELRARTTGKLFRDGANLMSDPDASTLKPDENNPLLIRNALIPIMTLIISAFIGFYFDGYLKGIADPGSATALLLKDSPLSFTAIRISFSNGDASIVLFQAALLASITAIIMGIKQKIFNIGESLEVWLTGAKSLLITAVILTLAWSLSGVVKELGTATYLVSVLSESLPPFFLSSMIFILGAVISFATGTSYGTMGILMPLAIPLAYALNPEPLYMSINISAVLTGAIFGDHCSPISDTTILSSMGASCDHIDHTQTQLFYAVIIAVLSVVIGYIPVSLSVPVWIVLPFSMFIVFISVRLFGKTLPTYVEE